MSQSPIRFLLLLGSILIASQGCIHYKLGPTGEVEAGQKSIQVNLFENQTDEPRLIEAVATSLRREIQRDGTYRLDTHGEGDLIVKGALTDFTLDGLSYRRGDVLTIKDYRATLTARVTAVERLTGKTNLDQVLHGYTTLRFEGDLGNAIRQTVPLMADDLSRKVVLHLVDGDWE